MAPMPWAVWVGVSPGTELCTSLTTTAEDWSGYSRGAGEGAEVPRVLPLRAAAASAKAAHANVEPGSLCDLAAIVSMTPPRMAWADAAHLATLLDRDSSTITSRVRAECQAASGILADSSVGGMTGAVRRQSSQARMRQTVIDT